MKNLIRLWRLMNGERNLYLLEATTYNAIEEPEYVWEIDNPAVAEIILENNNAHSIVIRTGGIPGTNELTVTYIVNDYIRIIDIISEVDFRKSEFKRQ